MSEKQDLTRQINIVKGQLEGIRKMLESEEDCAAVINQIKAAKSGLNRMAKALITSRFNECMTKGKTKMNPDELDSLLNILSRY